MKTKYHRRDFMKTLGASMAACTLPGCFDAVTKPPVQQKPPNILIMFTDDQRFSAIGGLGIEPVKTPNMDQLMQRGATFTHAHTMGSMHGALCIPARAALLTGRQLFHMINEGSTIPPDHTLLGEYLQQLGYTTFGTGKWHNGKQSYVRCFNDGGSIFFGGMHFSATGGHATPEVFDFDPSGKYPGENKYQADKYSSQLYSDQAIRFLEQHQSDDPFFLYVSYSAPHDPRMAPPEYLAMYPPENIELPPNFMPQHPFDNGDMNVRDENLAPKPRTPEVVRRHIAEYYAAITYLDAQIGRVLNTLQETGHADNTIIVFAGDNGLAVGQHGLLGKQSLYDHSIRVPLILAGPGIQAGKTSDTLCYLHDIFPTLCDLMHIPTPQSVEGASLTPILEGKTGRIRDNIFSAYSKLHRAVRNDRWKLIKYNVKGRQTTQLFDMINDPWEINNLADDPAHADKINELTNLLKLCMKQSDDNCDLDKPNWGIVSH